MDIGVSAKELTGSREPITVWNAETLFQQRNHPHYGRLVDVIDTMGVMSKTAQGINAPLTSVQRLRDNPTHTLYLLCVGEQCLGILKSGVKKLFIRTANAQLVEMDPMCVLDFYVCTSEQRAGHGRTLYDYMLSYQNVHPAELGIDRPSPKFLAFMKKHFGLSDYIPQTNNFVVYNQYFEIAKPLGRNRYGVAKEAQPPVVRQSQAMTAPVSSTTAPKVAPVPLTVPQPSPVAPLQPYQLKGVIPGNAISTASRAADIPRGGATPFSSMHQQRSSLLASQLSDMSLHPGRRTTSPTRSSANYNILAPQQAPSNRGRGRM